MKTCLWLLLTLLLIIAGCSPSYYAAEPSYQVAPFSSGFYGTSFSNPETEEEKSMRIWREEAGR
jgi:hypothetical protein